jgi:iron complex transport system ATP-binding protein
MTLLDLENLTVLRGECPVVDGVSLTVSAGECVGLIGPNGAGKTTLMRAAQGLLPFRGRTNLVAMTPEDRARAVAWLPQSREIAWPVNVAALVALGRLPHGPAKPGDAAVASAMARMGLTAMADRRATDLSGGEQARVLIARALAQEAPLLMADEPIAGLDPAAQIATMRVFVGLAREGRAVLLALHDLGLAARHCTRLVVLHRGKVAADGPPRDVLTPDVLARVFDIRAHYGDTADGPVFQPLDTVGGH